MKNLIKKTALITGASSGIGEAFAYELAKGGVNVILTARSEQKLQDIAQKIQSIYAVNVLVLSEDLAAKGSAESLFRKIKAANWSVDLLVNNAGVGKWAGFLEETAENYEEMIELNITSLMKLTYLVLPEMLRKGEGGIINVASTGAFQPCPYIAVYCASKAFVLSFSEALYGEYHSKGIMITALCPGNTATGFQSYANADTRGMRSDTPERVAKEGIAAMLKGKSYTIVGMDNYLQSLLPRLLPRKTIIDAVGGMMGKKVYKK
ncbi:SDR family NAD(P)-dependent oxidoreductase [Runella slithyformis]|uniref:Short-chain dehydrogenase/reductase SDR n=1 Tax=Runella slithyformis (strain ATCC 29530 / DSM 19594 / LMG 11500 / NCIMB 11436 / LSU 4) TaxID=761193 RepID=A0A7U4E8F5_RUNSL|nr:SDR family oxidoreductase [Runella slithyformis]AEI51663.1 short-chain dehydrogenase/reductase SDR [Runella slithyformis DSM 19594]